MRRCKSCGRLVEDHIAVCPFCLKSPEGLTDFGGRRIPEGPDGSGGRSIPDGPAGPGGRRIPDGPTGPGRGRIPDGPAGPGRGRIPDGPGYPAGPGRDRSGPPPADPGWPGTYPPGPGRGYGPADQTDFNKKKGMSPETKKKLIIGIVAASVLLIVAIIGIILLMRSGRTVDLETTYKMELEGYDGYGTAHVYLDKEKLDAALAKAMGSKYRKMADGEYAFSGDSMRMYSAYSTLISGSIKYSCDKTEDLKNGNTVHIKIEYDQEAKDAAKVLGVILKGSEVEYKVKGLEKAELYSPLDGDFEIEFYGTAPYAEANVTYTGDKEGIFDECFKLDKTEGIGLDDTLKVSFDPSQIDENEAAANGYIIDETKTDVEYKVKAGDVDYYLKNAGEVDDQVLESLKPKAEKAILDYFDDISEYVSIGEPRYAASYVFISKYQETWDPNNYVDLIYTISVSSKEGTFKTQDIYIPIEFNDVTVQKDGQIPDRYASSPLGETDLEYNKDGWSPGHVKGYKNKTDMERELANDKGNNFNGSVTKGFKD